MLKISEFSRLTQVPAKTLRYYDELGLFSPAHSDPFTGYRYYSVEQLPRLNRILALKGLGLSLEQIAQLLRDDLPAQELREMLRAKEAETRQRLAEEHRRLQQVAARLRQIEDEGRVSDYEIVLKPVPPLRVISLRQIVPDLSQIAAALALMFPRLEGHVAAQRAGPAAPALILYHDSEFHEQNIDIEAALPISGEIPTAAPLRVHTLPAALMACTIHRGAYEDLGRAHVAILRWAASQPYQIGAPNREIFLQARTVPDKLVTEIQYPLLETRA
ncbi:MAG: MerR family transcriptional regulator [Chloroflexi bacterium]|nr:MerR family transcriptional regulator [Chloroflexota bacterium]